MALVPAWNTETGERCERLVPDTWIGHPILGPHLSANPPKAAEATETPAAETRRTRTKEA